MLPCQVVLLYLIEILHQTTTACTGDTGGHSCILSKFYIKPQPRFFYYCCLGVVSYRNSTSNHNVAGSKLISRSVVSYRNSTSNHNIHYGFLVPPVVVSYRNSTSNHNIADKVLPVGQLYLIEILHQTTTYALDNQIKAMLYLIEILHQTTTIEDVAPIIYSCILSKFYIKPQRISIARSWNRGLYLIEILHQTTTLVVFPSALVLLYLIEILHQTTTQLLMSRALMSCILSKFYIKPQQPYYLPFCCVVVSYRNSTSNHNDVRSNPLAVPVVSYRNSTSNHNRGCSWGTRE